MKRIVLVFCTLLMMQCSFSQQKEFTWLVGTWKLKDKSMYELWQVSADGKSLVGNSFRVNGSDTTALEEIRFTFASGSYHYIPDIAGEQGPVDFKVTSYSADGFVAENPQHDFPKLIRYKLVRRDGRDFVEATIEGNGKVIPFHYERVR